MAFLLGLSPLSYAVPLSVFEEVNARQEESLTHLPRSQEPVIASFTGGSATPASDEDRQSAIDIIKGYVKPLYGGREISIFGSFYYFDDKEKTTVRFALADPSNHVIPSLGISCSYCRGVAKKTGVGLVSGVSRFQSPARYEGKLTTNKNEWPMLT
ncbi:hypothetical protein F5050DRAFT_1711156 [Lentinula boryana]|uniref:Uncharacterized protein n=1 Tax=Lentinula boryana TaxID=40481 RepID=A0ABQ8QGP6_9AGAR|nr:hypothetical protein F5050DRAFT_1711156 [Lentinula boryana]